jgi:hypothetical protein
MFFLAELRAIPVIFGKSTYANPRVDPRSLRVMAAPPPIRVFKTWTASTRQNVDGQHKAGMTNSEIVRIGINRSSIFWTKGLCGCGLLWKRAARWLSERLLLCSSSSLTASPRSKQAAACEDTRGCFFQRVSFRTFSDPPVVPKNL